MDTKNAKPAGLESETRDRDASGNHIEHNPMIIGLKEFPILITILREPPQS
jgi:hypothetical protein